MDSHLWQRLKPLFAEARHLEPEQWGHFLETRCDDDETRRELQALLEGDRQATGELLDMTPKADPVVGRRIGRYEIVHRLADGGMGQVYRARRIDEDFHKRVALKLIRPGMVNDELIRRFHTERQILAALDHPAIAKLLDGGTTEDGLPYFVMEYVEGQPIDRYCDVHGLDISQRVELFCEVCEAVQFAHRNLVVHRDLKPGNILITAEGRPKLLDFGIAKLLNIEMTSGAPAATLVGRLLTPDYASPEQIRGESVTTASDVYSLGVLLYYLLSGHLPYRTRGLSAGEMERLVCESEPGRPSARVREGNSAKLSRRLAGDLDNIVARALRKEPRRRYDSVGHLAADLRCHLQGRPVLASGDSLGYRVGKFARRHRMGVAVAATLTLAVVGFAVAMGVLAAQLAREKARAEREWKRAEQVTVFLTEIFEVSDPLRATGETVTAREILDSGAHKLAAGLEDQPEVRVALMRTIAKIYRRLGLPERAAPLLASALQQCRALLGDEHPETAALMHELAILRVGEAEYAAAEDLLRQALALRRKLWGPKHPEVAKSLNDLAMVLYFSDRFGEAESLLREALGLRRELYGQQHLDIAESSDNLGIVLLRQGRYQQAEELFEEALGLRRELLGERNTKVADTLSNLANVLEAQGEKSRAEKHFRTAHNLYTELLDPKHPRLAIGLDNLGHILQSQGKFAAAEPYHREALALRRELFGPDHPDVANSLENLGHTAWGLGRFDEAERLAREALDIRYRYFGEEHTTIAGALRLAGLARASRGEHAAAEETLHRVLDMRLRLLGSEHPDVALSRRDLAAVRAELAKSGKP